MTRRIANGLAGIVCLACTIYFLRNAFLVARPSNEAGNSFKTGAIILAVVFGSIAVVLLYRAVREQKK